MVKLASTFARREGAESWRQNDALVMLCCKVRTLLVELQGLLGIYGYIYMYITRSILNGLMGL